MTIECINYDTFVAWKTATLKNNQGDIDSHRKIFTM